MTEDEKIRQTLIATFLIRAKIQYCLKEVRERYPNASIDDIEEALKGGIFYGIVQKAVSGELSVEDMEKAINKQGRRARLSIKEDLKIAFHFNTHVRRYQAITSLSEKEALYQLRTRLKVLYLKRIRDNAFEFEIETLIINRGIEEDIKRLLNTKTVREIQANPRNSR